MLRDVRGCWNGHGMGRPAVLWGQIVASKRTQKSKMTPPETKKTQTRNVKTILGFKVKLVMVRSSAAPKSPSRAKQAGVHALLGGPLDPKDACTPSRGLVQPTPNISECTKCLIVNHQKT